MRRACLIVAMLLAGCGTIASPVLHQSTATLETVEQNQIETELPATIVPTETLVPPTETPTPASTDTPIPQPTATPEPTDAPVQSPIDRLVAVRDAANGAVLFDTYQEAAKYSCSNCHSPSSEKTLIGPGLLNIKDRAGSRVEGQSAAEYIYNSIIDTNAYIVEGFDENLMPANWAEIYSDLEIFDIVAYLLTLEGESDLDAPDPARDTPPVDMSVYGEIALPETANAERGAELFQTYYEEAGYACATCHLDDTEDRLIGPGLLNVGSRAQTRVEGLSDIEYLFTKIVNPSAYTVADYDGNLEPRNWAQIFSEADIYDIVAYLLTLEG